MEVDHFHELESALFGRAARSDANDKQPTSAKSAVKLHVRIIKAPAYKAAGTHTADAKSGKLRPFPEMGKECPAYGAFPLFRQKEQLVEAARRGARRLDTPPVWTKLQFDLEVRLRPLGPLRVGERLFQPQEQQESLEQALALWIVFGGVGARTRRAFGALAPRSPMELAGVNLGTKALDVAQFIQRDSSVLVATKEFPTAAEAHTELLSSLRTFRQGSGFARPETGSNHPGPSFWPEPHTMKLAAKRAGILHKPLEHDIAPHYSKAGRLFAPRAAYGMPLLITFKQADAGDAQANGKLLPSAPDGAQAVADRMPSPLIFSVIKKGDHFLAVALTLPLPVTAARVWLDTTKKADDEATLLLDNLPETPRPLREWLTKGKAGGAIGAFMDWLWARRSFKADVPDGKKSSNYQRPQ
jgi:hypothetical protein